MYSKWVSTKQKPTFISVQKTIKEYAKNITSPIPQFLLFHFNGRNPDNFMSSNKEGIHFQNMNWPIKIDAILIDSTKPILLFMTVKAKNLQWLDINI